MNLSHYNLDTNGYLNNNSPKIEQPINIRIPLFLHQRSIIYAATELEKNNIVIQDNLVTHTKVGIISDPVGSGKTLEILGLICHNEKPGQSTQLVIGTSTEFLYSYRIGSQNFNYYSSLIVVPHTLVNQWELSLSELINTKYYVIKNKKTLDKYSEDIENKLVLISNTFVKKFKEKFSNHYNWNRIIIDEPQDCNIQPLSNDINKCLFIWFVCATPNLIYTSYKNTFKYIFGSNNWCNINRRNTISKIALRNSTEYIKQSIQLPPINIETIECYTPSVLRYLGNDLPNKVLDLLQAGCNKEALEFLKCKTHTEDNIVTAVTEYYKTKLINIEQKINYINSLVISENDKKRRLESPLNKKKSLEVKIKGIEERISKIGQDECPICTEEFKNPMITPCCQNIFCLECLVNNYKFKKNCPMCRSEEYDLNKTYAIVKDKDTEVKSKKKELPDKNKALINILQSKKTDSKTLIFSHYDESFYSIKNILTEENIGFEELSGQGASIKNKIDRFTDGKNKVLLLNTRNFGSGINLQMTTDLIIYHKLEPELEKQVIGRAQRCGRQQPLNLTYLKYSTE